jgi:hypothetical protein
MENPVFTVPLAPLEKSLLLEVAQISNMRPDVRQVNTSLFESWSWTKLVSSSLKEDFDAENVAETYDNDLRLAYEDFLVFLACQGLLSSSRFRANAVRAANPNFIMLLTEHPIDAIRVGMHQEDTESWAIVSWMAQRGLLHCTTREPKYNIFKSVYSFQHRMARPENYQDIEQHVVNHHSLLETCTVERIPFTSSDATDGCFTGHSTAERFALYQKSSDTKPWPREEAYTDQNGEYTDSWLKYTLGIAYSEQATEGILENICMLPFADLHDASAHNISGAGVNLYIPFMDQGNFTQLRWMTWKPIFQTPMGRHLLYTEDEVYQYCLLNRWYFPDHLCGEEVLFAMRPVEHTEFFVKMRDFWSSWVSSNVPTLFRGASLTVTRMIAASLGTVELVNSTF